MFVIQNIKSSQEYCICEHSWKHFKIVDINPLYATIKIDITSYGGLKKNLIDIEHFRCVPNFLRILDFEFEAREHVKIEICGGGYITLLGESYNGGSYSNIHSTCPFKNLNKYEVERKIEQRQNKPEVKLVWDQSIQSRL